MLAETAPQSLDATAGGTVTGPRGSSITIPPASLVTSAGAVVTGTVAGLAHPHQSVGPDAGRGLPGGFASRDDGRSERIPHDVRSARHSGDPRGERPQFEAWKHRERDDSGTVEEREPPASVGSWSLDETTGIWKEEGTATLNAAAHVYAMSLPHLSDWNADVFNLPGCIYGQLVDERMKPLTNGVIMAFTADNLSGSNAITDQNGYFCLVMGVDSSGTTLRIYPSAQANPALYYPKFIGNLPNHEVSSSVFMCNDPLQCAQLMKVSINPSEPPPSLDGGTFDSGFIPTDSGTSAGQACTLGKDAGAGGGAGGDGGNSR